MIAVEDFVASKVRSALLTLDNDAIVASNDLVLPDDVGVELGFLHD